MTKEEILRLLKELDSKMSFDEKIDLLEKITEILKVTNKEIEELGKRIDNGEFGEKNG